MAKWFVAANGAENGPFDDQVLRAMARDGSLKPADRVRRDDMKASLPAGKVRGLFSSTFVESAAEPTPEPPPEPAKRSSLRDATDSLARIAAIKKIELHDLSEAEFALGRRAYEESVGRDSFGEAFAAIRDLEQTIAMKKRTSDVPAHETLTDRTKRLANEGKKRIEAELLLKQRKQKLVEIGRRIHQDGSNSTWGSLQNEINAVTELLGKLSALRAEEGASGGGSQLKKRLIQAAIAALVLVAGGITLNDFLTVTPEERQAANIARRDAEEQSHREDLRRQEQESYERQEADRRAHAAAEAKRQSEQAQQRLAEEAATRKRQQEEREAELEEEQLADEQERRAEEDFAERERADRAVRERQRQEEIAEAAAVQVARQRFAQSLFSKVNLTPAENVKLAPSVAELGVVVEIKSADVNKLNEMLAKKDWLGLVNHLTQSDRTEYPDESTIDAALGQMNVNPFWILVRTDRQDLVKSRGPTLTRVLLSKAQEVDEVLGGDAPRIAELDTDWRPHPDGIGYLIPWRPLAGEVIVTMADDRELRNAIYRVRNEARDQCLAIRSKVQLGEISSEAAKEQIGTLVTKAQELVKTALMKNE